ncbi:unnamed protein product [Wuchereria bancrofti]|uniref:Uncharacterized protein n=1 Tax=Wuchereria bancrofti TaxID=6293 RepID=A0A3P7FPU5_WUCBA|nr:unnamed protein product [Wuchereria bancrofti]
MFDIILIFQIITDFFFLTFYNTAWDAFSRIHIIVLKFFNHFAMAIVIRVLVCFSFNLNDLMISDSVINPVHIVPE